MSTIFVIVAFLVGGLCGFCFHLVSSEKEEKSLVSEPQSDELALEKEWENLLRYDGNEQEE